MWSRRPRADVDLPRPLPDRVLRQPRDARLPRPPAVAHGHRRLARVRARARPRPRRAAVGTRSRASSAPRTGVEVDGEHSTRSSSPTHSDQALALLADPTDAEREVLGAIPYQANEAVLHTDASVMPNRRRAWASWNYHLGLVAAGRSTVTYWMNRLQSLRRRHATTSSRSTAREAIDPAKVIRTIDYAHPVFTREGMRAQARHAEVSGRRPHPLLRRLLGLGLPRGRRCRAGCAWRSAFAAGGGAGMTDVYVGTVRHRRFTVRDNEFRPQGRLRATSTSSALPRRRGLGLASARATT